MNHFELLREIWPLLRRSLLDPLEILPNIRGFTDNDIEGIKAAMNTSKMNAIDRLYEALRRRDINCFRSFLCALWSCHYRHIAERIMEIGGIHDHEQFLGVDARPTLLNSEEQRVHDNISAHVSQANCSSLQSSISPSQTQSSRNQASLCSILNKTLSRETKLEDVSYDKSHRWVDELNKDKLWKELCKKLPLRRKEVTEDISKAENPVEELLDKLEERNFSVGDLLRYLEGDKFSNLCQLIREDLGEMDYNILGNSSQDENNQNSGAFGNVVLGLSARNDSANNLEEKIENKPTNSISQNLDISSTSRPPNSSNFSASLDSKKKSEMDKITLTGHNMTYTQNSSGQKEDQLAKNPRSPETISRQPTESCDTSPPLEKEARSAETMSKEHLKSDDISPIIKQSQKEIALINKKKGLDEPYNDTSQMADINVSEQTSLKSQFLDDNLNNPESLELKEPKTGPENAAPNPDGFSVLYKRKEDDENKGPSIEHGLQKETERSHGLVVSEEHGASNQKGSSLMEGIEDFQKELKQVNFQQKSMSPRPPGNSINIPVQTAGRHVVSDEQGASNQKGSSLMEGIQDLQKELKQVNIQQKSMSPRPPGNSINIPVQTAGTKEVSRSSGYSMNLPNHVTESDMGNLMAAPESSEPPPSSQYNLFESGSENRSTAGNVMASQHSQNCYTTPLPVTDDSDTKNMEMEANALREDITNPTYPEFRDIQNSIPEPRGSNEEDRDNQPSLVNQFCYSAEAEVTRSQGQTNISNVPSDPSNI